MEIPEHSSNAESSLYQKAVGIFEELLLGVSSTNLKDWDIARTAAHLLQDWKLPETCSAAALLMPVLRYLPKVNIGLPNELGDAVTLAQRAIAWQAGVEPGNTSTLGSYQLRRLLCQVYIDYPDFQYILLLFAIHEASYDHDRSYDLAQQSRDIFIPLAEILNTWDLHQAWQEKSLEFLVTEDPNVRKRYESICAEVLGTSWDGEKELERLIQECDWIIRKSRDNQQTLKEEAWYKANKKRISKAYAYQSIKKALQDEFSDQKITPQPVIAVRFLEPGDLYLRESHTVPQKRGDTAEEILKQIWLTITCGREHDCYAILGAIHRLGKPVALRFGDYFEDNVVAVQPNGYRGLRTAIIYTFIKPTLKSEQRSQVLVEFRIFTERMQKINSEGVIEAFFKNPSDFTTDEEYALAWWHPEHIKQLLEQISSKAQDSFYSSIKDYLNLHDLSSTPRNRDESIFVFTPMGEIVPMEAGSMPLDFAYWIHSELGNQAAYITVNGQEAQYNVPLRDGDIVQVGYDPKFSGLDISWLGLVKTKKARKIIKKQLKLQIGMDAPGKHKIWEELERQIIFYRNIKNYSLRITNAKLDAFLEYYATTSALPSIEALYNSVDCGKAHSKKLRMFHARNIVEQLISKELAASLVGGDERPLEYSLYHKAQEQFVSSAGGDEFPYRVFLCPQCHPVPGEAVVAYESRRNPAHVTVHLNNSSCSHGTRRFPAHWVSGPTPSSMCEYQILAQNRLGLLGDILKRVYEHPGCSIDQVNARVMHDSSAEIYLITTAPNSETLIQIRQRMQKEISGLRQIVMVPISPHEISMATLPETHYNPYRQADVFRRIDFYDRESQKREILSWLRDESANHWIILHGQRRIGKTCFVKYLSYTVLLENGIAFPVYLDLLRLEGAATQFLANRLLRTLSTILHLEFPDQEEGETARLWLQRSLELASESRKGQPLLIVLDEVDSLFTNQGPALDVHLFNDLLFIMNSVPDIRWLLVMSDMVFQNPSVWGTAGYIFGKADSVFISELEPNYAARMIREPAELNGFRFADSDDPDKYSAPCQLIKNIMEESGDNPYYIKRICYHLIDRLRRNGRFNITDIDLELALRDVLQHGHSYFEHFLHYLNPIRELILVIAARICTEHAYATVDQIMVECQQENPQWNESEILEAIGKLDHIGSIQTTREKLLYFRVNIFARYVNEILSPIAKLHG
jgi:(p)ppGpp synthase/HD superfamily hydrolase